MAENGHNQNARTRLDRVEAIVEALANNQDKIQDDIRVLMRSQVLMSETIEKLGGRVEQLVQAQQHTDDRLNALIDYFQRHLEEHGKQE
jgi:ABC-type transporter Mla subunit MlaD